MDYCTFVSEGKSAKLERMEISANFQNSGGSASKRLPGGAKIANEIKHADVAELVDARDL